MMCGIAQYLLQERETAEFLLRIKLFFVSDKGSGWRCKGGDKMRAQVLIRGNAKRLRKLSPVG